MPLNLIVSKKKPTGVPLKQVELLTGFVYLDQSYLKGRGGNYSPSCLLPVLNLTTGEVVGLAVDTLVEPVLSTTITLERG